MAAIAFSKWEGLGNDFVVVSADEPLPWERLAPRVCDRRFGLGGDGVLVVGRHPASMVVFNADGSRPEMCGNGLRCVAGFLADADGVDVGDMSIATDVGPRTARVRRTDARSFDVTVDMGPVSFASADAGFVGTDAGDAVAGEGIVVSVGNPHWVFLEPGREARIDVDGPRLEKDVRVTRGANIEFVYPGADGTWTVDVWERGAGRTLACGTGAIAVASALVNRGRASKDAPIRIRLPGGILQIVIRATGETVMQGPARCVARGTLERALIESDAR